MIDTVYFDMDGVLTDFNTTVLEMTGKSVHSLKTRGEYDKFMIENAPRTFYVDMEPSVHLVDMVRLMSELKKANHRIEILTSYGPWYSDFGVTAHRGKVQWLNDHLKGSVDLIDAFHGVPLCNDKHKFGSPNTYLIDDQLENCVGFAERGGKVNHYSIMRHNDCLELIRKDLGV